MVWSNEYSDSKRKWILKKANPDSASFVDPLMIAHSSILPMLIPLVSHVVSIVGASVLFFGVGVRPASSATISAQEPDEDKRQRITYKQTQLMVFNLVSLFSIVLTFKIYAESKQKEQENGRSLFEKNILFEISLGGSVKHIVHWKQSFIQDGVGA